MLIQQIMEDDILNCYQVYKKDEQLKDLEKKLYEVMAKCPEDVFYDMEETVNAYGARITRLAYLQGIKDFAKLHIILKEDIHDILQKNE